MKRTYCDGCDMQIIFDDTDKPKEDARVDLRVNFYCISQGEELGQFASERIDLCGGCIAIMKRMIDPRKWDRPTERVT